MHGNDTTGQGRGIANPSSRRDKKLAGESSSSRPLKRRCVSNACIACRRRKSKCDGNTPACAACASVYHTDCVYDPNSDHRRKGVYKADIDNLKNQNSTLQTLIEAILKWPEDRVFDLVRQIRSCDSLEDLADSIIAETGNDVEGDSPESQGFDSTSVADGGGQGDQPMSLEAELSGKMGQLRLEDGQVRFIGATSSLMFVPTARDEEEDDDDDEGSGKRTSLDMYEKNPITTWTTVTKDAELVNHLVTMYFSWHYPYFTTLSKDLFYKEFVHGLRGNSNHHSTKVYCTPLLVNAMLALGCHFTAVQGSRVNPNDPATAGDHFFKEAKRLIYENDEHETPRLPTVQALALMSVREAGCGREATGWVYSGMSFRMAMDMGLHLDPSSLNEGMGTGSAGISDEEVDARRVTFWGCYLFDKCWSNYMGRMPQLPSSMVTCPKPEVFPSEDADNWYPYTDSGHSTANPQPSRIRAVALRISILCEISNDVLLSFYNTTPGTNTTSGTVTADATATIKVLQQGKSSAAGEFKKLGELFTRLEDWRKRLPPELEAKEGSLPSVLLMHMFHQTLYIHLFRPFLKFTEATTSTLSHLDPRKACLTAATIMSKYLRFYKRRYGLKQICNVAGYFIQSACTIHLLNLSQKTVRRDMTQSLKYLEEMGEFWLLARRALIIVGFTAKRWGIKLPEEAESVLQRSWSHGRRFGLAAEVEKVLGRRVEKEKKKHQDATVTQSPPPPPSSIVNMYGSPTSTLQLAQHQRQQTYFPDTAATAAKSMTSSPSPYFDTSHSPIMIPASVHSHQSPQQQFYGQQLQQPYMNLNAAPSPSSGGVSTPQSVLETGDSYSQDWWFRDQTELATDLVGIDWNFTVPGEQGHAIDGNGGNGPGQVGMGGLDGLGNW